MAQEFLLKAAVKHWTREGKLTYFQQRINQL